MSTKRDKPIPIRHKDLPPKAGKKSSPQPPPLTAYERAQKARFKKACVWLAKHIFIDAQNKRCINERYINHAKNMGWYNAITFVIQDDVKIIPDTNPATADVEIITISV